MRKLIAYTQLSLRLEIGRDHVLYARRLRGALQLCVRLPKPQNNELVCVAGNTPVRLNHVFDTSIDESVETALEQS